MTVHLWAACWAYSWDLVQAAETVLQSDLLKVARRESRWVEMTVRLWADTSAHRWAA